MKSFNQARWALERIPSLQQRSLMVCPAEPPESDADLLFSGELAVGNALDVSDKSLGLLAPGFSLPELV
jgi:hypothetical protein